jgi:hypothetical protein
MRTENMKEAAAHCRHQATDFEGKPEEQFLLRLAYCFEKLASASLAASSRQGAVGRYSPPGPC